jgi:hypothetical protein
MIGALVTFLVLYGLLYWLERNRTEVDAFSIGAVAVVPVLLVVLVSIGLAFLYPDPVALAVVPLLTLLVATFVLLLKIMRLSVGRSAAYTAVVLVLNVGLSFAVVNG